MTLPGIVPAVSLQPDKRERNVYQTEADQMQRQARKVRGLPPVTGSWLCKIPDNIHPDVERDRKRGYHRPYNGYDNRNNKWKCEKRFPSFVSVSP